MAYRDRPARSVVDFDDRETYYTSAPARSRAPVREYEDIEIRSRSRDRESRVPGFMREDARRSEAGPLVLRQRDIETVERRRPRSPSPVRTREMRIVERTRSISPGPARRRVSLEREREDVRVRTFERERVRSPSRGPPIERVRTRIVEREPSPSPPPAHFDREHERIRIVERERERERIPSPSPSPPPPPAVIKGPTIEREVITHYRDIDHGVIRAPSPPPPPRPRERERETDIDIYTSRHETEVDIHRSSRRARSPSRERLPPPRPAPSRVYEDDVYIRSGRDRVHVDISEERRSDHKRAHSAAPSRRDYEDDDEGRRITSRIDSRGQMGEAWHGVTKDWTIVDVPPGTERVRMDGAGGGGAEVTWQKYSGVRRSKFVPERDSETVVSSPSTASLPRERDRGADHRLSVQIYKDDRGGEREVDVNIDKTVSDRRISIRDTPPPPAPPPRQKRTEMWTEITKDLVIREAIEELGYEYEETDQFYYIMQYLKYDDVLELVQLSDTIRGSRRERVREIQWERELKDTWERGRVPRHKHRHSRSTDRYGEERVVEREYIYDSSRPTRYIH